MIPHIRSSVLRKSTVLLQCSHHQEQRAIPLLALAVAAAASSTLGSRQTHSEDAGPLDRRRRRSSGTPTTITEDQSLSSFTPNVTYKRKSPGSTTPTTPGIQEEPEPQSPSPPYQQWRAALGSALTLLSFGTNVFRSLPITFDEIMNPPLLQKLYEFLSESGLDQEILETLQNRRLLTHVGLLWRVQEELIREQHYLNNNQISLDNLFMEEEQHSVSIDDLYLFMRCATAAYGQHMIQAAVVETDGLSDDSSYPYAATATRQYIADHVGIDEDDVIFCTVDDDDDEEDDNDLISSDHQEEHLLKQFVAIDHNRKTVVWSLRGTSSFHDVLVDTVAHSRPFLAGRYEAHSEMANMAERLLQSTAGDTVTNILKEFTDYQLVITGHSLGAGTACLLTLLMQERKLKSTIKCFAFGAPPVLSESISHPIRWRRRDDPHQAIYHVIHEFDVVPTLSVHTVRQWLASLRVIQEYDSLSRPDQYLVVAGVAPVPTDLVTKVKDVVSKLKPIFGAPLLYIPAANTLWIRNNCTTDDPASDRIDYGAYTMSAPLDLGMLTHPQMISDHFPSRYEFALNELSSQTKRAKAKKKHAKERY